MTYTPSTPLVVQISDAYGLRPDLLAAQIHAESSGIPTAFRYEHEFFERYILNRASASGYRFGPLAACSYGLLQIMLETALEMGYDDRPEDLFDAKIGLSWGAKYLRHCLDICGGDYRRALARYNGSGARADAYATRVFALCDQQAKDTIV